MMPLLGPFSQLGVGFSKNIYLALGLGCCPEGGVKRETGENPVQARCCMSR